MTMSVYHDKQGIRVLVGYAESEIRDMLRKEYNAIGLGVLCDICKHNEAITIWIEGKRYCRDCREKESLSAGPVPTLPVDQHKRVHAVLFEQDSRYLLYMGETHIPVTLPSTVEAFLPIFEEYGIHTLWVMPGCQFSSGITWAYIGTYDHTQYRVFPDKALEGVREKRPSYMSIRREGYGYNREYFLAFPQHEQWLDSGKTWACSDAETLYQTVSYVECEYPHFGYSTQNMGKNLLKTIHEKQEWKIPETILTDKLKRAIKDSVQRPMWLRDGGLSKAQKKMKWVIGGDKNGQYVGGTRSLELGTGQCVEVHPSAFDRKTPGLWLAEVTSVEHTIFNSYDLFCPWTEESHWFSTDLLTACEKVGIQFRIHEGLIWREHKKYMDMWGKEIWQHRAAYQDTERYPHAQARKNAMGTAKQAGNSFIGLIAHKASALGKGMVYRPDWNILIIHKALANLIYSLKARYDAYGVLPVILAKGDTQWFVSNEPTVPTLFDHSKEQRGWKPIGKPIPMSKEIAAMFETQDASEIANFLEKKAKEL